MSDRATAADFAAARERLSRGDLTVKRTRRYSPRPFRRGVPLMAARGSRQSAATQDVVRLLLKRGDSVNAIAVSVGISHDAVETIRDGYSKTVRA